MGPVMRGVVPFLLAQLAVLFLLVLVPQLVTVPLSWFR
jgi:TRAP-type C4-dicarboxylate transport system permease large subunit